MEAPVGMDYIFFCDPHLKTTFDFIQSLLENARKFPLGKKKSIEIKILWKERMIFANIYHWESQTVSSNVSQRF